jgi:hypothetical protein
VIDCNNATRTSMRVALLRRVVFANDMPISRGWHTVDLERKKRLRTN